MSRKLKRVSILAVIIYIMINSFVWGLMKAYINSHNAISNEKLVMAQITDSPNGKKISVMGNSFYISSEKKEDNRLKNTLESFIPAKIKAASEIFKRTGRDIVREVLQCSQNFHDNCSDYLYK